jgi:hypothetical protein
MASNLNESKHAWQMVFIAQYVSLQMQILPQQGIIFSEFSDDGAGHM